MRTFSRTITAALAVVLCSGLALAGDYKCNAPAGGECELEKPDGSRVTVERGSIASTETGNILLGPFWEPV